MSEITGTSCNDNLNGGSGDDCIYGGDGNDKLSGGAGDDELYGGCGNDSLVGGSGEDLLDGGSGNDVLNGGSGDDILVYKLCENSGATDSYTGGSGWDVVRIMLTSEEWLYNETVQGELTRYFTHLETVKRNAQTGEVSNGTKSDFTFHFDNATLTVSMMEELQIYVDGELIENLGQPVVDGGSFAGAVYEDGDSDSSVATSQSASGDITFFDLDVTVSHTVTVNPPSGAIGTLSATITNLAFGDGQGVVGWTYTLNNAAAQSLAAGQEKLETFTVVITDDEGHSVSQEVTITVAGTNDAATINVVGSEDTSVKEDDTGNGTAGGTLSVSDVDTGEDTFQAPASLNGTYGTFTFDAGTGAWGYTLDNGRAATQALNDGATATDSLTVVSKDGTASHIINVTVNGTADGPVAPPPVVTSADPNDNDSTGPGAAANLTVQGGSLNGNNNNTVIGTNVVDNVSAGAGADLIYGYGGNDTLNGDNDTDRIYGGSGNDVINGGQGTDTIYGGSGNDNITGGSQTDTIYGGSGNDTIAGDSDADIIIGGYGADSLTGNGGVDTFRFLSELDTGDTITDFSSAQGDKIDLLAIDSGAAGGAFVWGGNTTTLTAHGVIWFADASGVTIQADTDGDVSTAEFQILLSGTVTSVSATDFLL